MSTPDSRFVRAAMAIALLASTLAANATEVSLVGVFPGRAAVLSIDGAAPRTLRIGQPASGVNVLSVAQDRVELQVDGQRRTVLLGQYSTGGTGARPSTTLSSDARGHFFADGAINGGSMRFMVDTGASVISIPAADANRLGIDYRKGRRVAISTANGQAAAWLVKFDTVRAGELELNNVDGVVIESGLEFALLGMSFLNRVEMKRDGATMTLVKRF